MTDQDIIRLAEAMGLYPNVDSAGRIMVGDSARTRHEFRPYTDANDDYSVLEWMRSQPDEDKWFLAPGMLMAWDYQIGDYARAALEELRDE